MAVLQVNMKNAMATRGLAVMMLVLLLVPAVVMAVSPAPAPSPMTGSGAPNSPLSSNPGGPIDTSPSGAPNSPLSSNPGGPIDISPTGQTSAAHLNLVPSATTASLSVVLACIAAAAATF